MRMKHTRVATRASVDKINAVVAIFVTAGVALPFSFADLSLSGACKFGFIEVRSAYSFPPTISDGISYTGLVSIVSWLQLQLHNNLWYQYWLFYNVYVFQQHM